MGGGRDGGVVSSGGGGSGGGDGSGGGGGSGGVGVGGGGSESTMEKQLGLLGIRSCASILRRVRASVPEGTAVKVHKVHEFICGHIL